MKTIFKRMFTFFLYFSVMFPIFTLQLGDGTTIPRFLPVLILENVKYIAIGSYSSFAIDKNGTLYGWGLNNAEEMLLYF